MPKAVFNGTVIAESDSVEEVEGTVYFPPDSLKSDFYRPTEHTTVCPWKGTANYYTLEVEGEVAENAAWIYRAPKSAAAKIADHVAFYPVVTIER